MTSPTLSHQSRHQVSPAVAVAGGALLVAALLGGCSAASPSDERSRHLSLPAPSVTWVADPEWQACANEKLGYEYAVEDAAAPDMSDGEGIIDTEEEWEGQRQLRAYGQCAFELDPDEPDLDDPAVRADYDFAYGITWGQDEPSEDALAPWPGKDNLG